jgi:hypothetical protein
MRQYKLYQQKPMMKKFVRENFLLRIKGKAGGVALEPKMIFFQNIFLYLTQIWTGEENLPRI